MSQPIVIPSDMNTNNVQKINTQNKMGGFNNTTESRIETEPVDNFPKPDFLREDTIPTQQPSPVQPVEQIPQKQINQESEKQNQSINVENTTQKIEQQQSTQERPIPQNIVKPEVQIRDVQVPTPEQIVGQNTIPQENSTIPQNIENTDGLDIFETSQKQESMSEQNKIEKIEDDLFSELITESVDSKEEKNIESSNMAPEEQAVEPVKRGRGRPRTKPIVPVDPNKPKRGRGRPRKIPAGQLQGEQLEVKQQEKIEQVQTMQEEIKPIETIQEEVAPIQNEQEEVKPVNVLQDAVKQEVVENDLFSMSEEIETTNTNNITNEQASVNINKTKDVDLFNMENEQPEETKTQQENDLIDLFDMNDTEPINDQTSYTQEPINQTPASEPETYEPINTDDKVESDLFNSNRDSSTVNLYEDNKDITTTNRVTSYSSLNTLLTADKKIVAFVGTTKNGTSFVVNNTAEMLSSMGISTAVLDMTKSKNSYYIYTNNEEELRKISTKCMKNLENGIAEGIKVTKTLTIYTQMPGEEEHYNIDNVLSTLVQNYSAVLIDTDFDTPAEIFDRVQEIYLVQSMDVLTIQPLTAFLRNLKSKNILRQEKLRIVINKSERVRSLNIKTLIGGMSCYNAPNMSYMTELFDKDNVRYCEIPFETQNYVKYLESLVVCSVTLSGYTKSLLASLKELASIVYPLVGKQTYSPMNGNNKKDPFSKQMSNTLNKMKNKGY